MNALMPVKATLLNKLSSRFAVDEQRLLTTLKATAFKVRDGVVTDEQMTALMVVADQYGLNPFTKELFAFPDKQNGIVPVVSVDGWARIINDHGALDGIEFRYADKVVEPLGGKSCPEWCEVVIRRKDRSQPIVVREYLDEVYRAGFRRSDGSTVSGPWQTHTKRFLRHKTLIQGARIAFGFSGIYDEDEAQRIIERDITHEGEIVTKPTIEGPKSKSTPEPVAAQVPAQPVSGAPSPEPHQEPAPATATEAFASPGHIKMIRARLKALSAKTGDTEQNVTARCLAGIKAETLDGITVRQGNLALDFILKDSGEVG